MACLSVCRKQMDAEFSVSYETTDMLPLKMPLKIGGLSCLKSLKRHNDKCNAHTQKEQEKAAVREGIAGQFDF
jgi:hypothetical protein